MISSLSRVFSSYSKLAELVFFPSFCQLCSLLLEGPKERVVCSSCIGKLKPYSSSYCLSCGMFFEGAGDPHLCQNCLRKRPPFSLHRSCSKYSGELKNIILLFKYRSFKVLGRDLAHFAYRALGKNEDLWWGAEIIIPVPLHPKRKSLRGFNRAQIIAKGLAKLKGIEVADRQLIKVRNVAPQTSLEFEERAKNVRGAFIVKEGERIRNTTAILVDDVYTTGSTIRECSLALLSAGVKEVRALTLAQA